MLVLFMFACGGEDKDTAENSNQSNEEVASQLPDTYEFLRVDGQSTVSNSGQIFRHVLIQELSTYIGGLTDSIDNGTYAPGTSTEVVDALHFYYHFDSDTSGDVPLTFSNTLQKNYNDISSSKDLSGKIAGNDSLTDHKNWTGGDFLGWSGATSPEALVQDWFETLGEQAVSRVGGTYVVDTETPVFITPEGLDLKQLTQKFLLGAVAFSQGADDYLDDDVDEKGLNASNIPDGESVYSDLAHAWDEGFGYYGAARNFAAYTDNEIASGEYLDMDGDDLQDLKTEKNWGNSVNSAKRDLGAVVATDFTADAWDGFLKGRHLIHTVDGELSDTQMDELKVFRDQAVQAWEKSISSTVVHYINDTLQDMNNFGSDDYKFVDHAKHWSEMKGFALGLQFNPYSLLTDTDFNTFHSLIGDFPVLEDATQDEISTYRQNLIDARTLLMESYGFDAANAGDEYGEGGW